MVTQYSILFIKLFNLNIKFLKKSKVKREKLKIVLKKKKRI